jgi:predicted homoserine dehydrogenase-like protein
MNYHNLFSSFRDRQLHTALIGAGQFGETFIRQSSKIPHFNVDFVCDIDPERARAALLASGVDKDNIAYAGSTKQAGAALSSGAKVVTDDFSIIEGLKLDCVVEATGNPEAAAQVAETALDCGFHLAMITKEADIVIGPYLHKKAKAAGLHVTPAHGDQPSLLISLISWVETLGMRVIAAGKSSEYDFVFDPADRSVSWRKQKQIIEQFDLLWHGSGNMAEDVRIRAEALSCFPQRTVPDLCEMGIVCNHTELRPDAPRFHAPHARTIELADVMAETANGGILAGTGAIDVFNCMRRIDEQSFGGGVFVIVDTEDDASWEVLAEKGICVSTDGRRGLLYNPSHLLGLEAPVSIMSTVWLGQPTGSRHIGHHVDLHAVANRNWKAGEILAITDHHHHEIAGLTPELAQATKTGTTGALPYYMAADNRLVCDVSQGQIIKADMVEPPQDSALWRLRGEMEACL